MFKSTTETHRACAIPELSQRVLAILYGASYFRHAIGPRRDLVFKLDRGLDIPLGVADQTQHLTDRSVPLAKGRVRAVVPFAVLYVHVRNALVMLFDEGCGGHVVARHEVPEIDVGTVMFRKRK